jgi:hypothetical protein
MFTPKVTEVVLVFEREGMSENSEESYICGGNNTGRARGIGGGCVYVFA